MTEYAYRSSRILARCLFASIGPPPCPPATAGCARELARVAIVKSERRVAELPEPARECRNADLVPSSSGSFPAASTSNVPVHAITRNSPLPLPFRPLA